MTVKETVLEIFQENIGKSISGQEIATRIGVSRNSVWKAVVQLKNEGYLISSQTRNGYVFSPDNDIFNVSSVKSLMKSEHEVIIIDKESSSNTIAKDLAAANAEEGTVVIVKSQTCGRGRMGRSFISSSENGLYMSIILRPKLPATRSVNVTVLCAVAVAEAIEETSGRECKIKWVNDIFINEKKSCGILTEASVNLENGQLDYAVVGIGVNIAPPSEDGFPDEIKDIAGSIYPDRMPKGYKSLLAVRIVDKFFKYYPDMEKKEYIKPYREKSNIIGEQVNVYIGNEIISGVVKDIDDDAALIVNTGNGLRKFNSGEARVRKI
ncbi:MAG: biotin--[acetyl-CoA-carboxylase] ligase [Eubacteriales bacterium]